MECELQQYAILHRHLLGFRKRSRSAPSLRLFGHYVHGIWLDYSDVRLCHIARDYLLELERQQSISLHRLRRVQPGIVDDVQREHPKRRVRHGQRNLERIERRLRELQHDQAN